MKYVFRINKHVSDRWLKIQKVATKSIKRQHPQIREVQRRRGQS